MGNMALKRRIGWIFGVSLGLALAGACSLNPQPIPPGAQAGESDASPTNAKDDGGKGAGGGSGDGGDGAFTNDDGGDAGEITDASDAGDAGEEDAGDSGDQ